MITLTYYPFLFTLLGITCDVNESIFDTSTKVFFLFCVAAIIFITILKKENRNNIHSLRRSCTLNAANASKECNPRENLPSDYFRKDYRQTIEWQSGYANLLFLRGRGHIGVEWSHSDEEDIVAIMHQYTKIENNNKLLKRILLKQLGELEAKHDLFFSYVWGENFRKTEFLIRSLRVSIPEGCDRYLWKRGFAEALFRKETSAQYIYIDKQASDIKAGFEAGNSYNSNTRTIVFRASRI